MAATQEVDTEEVNDSPEHSALLAARRWAMTALAVVGVSVQGLATYLSREGVTPQEATVTIVAIAMVVLGAILGARLLGLWILTAGAWLLVAANFLPGAETAWLFINSAALFGAFSLGLVAPLAWIPLAAVSLGLLLHFSWAAQPAAVLATGFSAWGGWIPSLQAVSVMVFMALLWRRMTRQAALLDQDFQLALRMQHRALAAHARETARRRATVAIHETLLNLIRSITARTDVPQQQLTDSLDRLEPLPRHVTGPQSMSALMAELQGIWGPTTQLTSSGTPSRALTPEQHDALRGALVELVRNAQAYEENPDTSVCFVASDEGVSARITGVTIAVPPERMGIGLRTSVTESIRAVGGRMEVRDDGIVLFVPAGDHEMPLRSSASTIFARSRSLMSMLLAGMVATGVLYFIALVTTDPQPGSVMLLMVALIGGLLAVAVPWRQRQLRITAAIGLTLIPASLPWIASMVYASGCGGVAPILASAINVSGFMVIIFTMWSRSWLLIPGLLLWGTGILSYGLLGPTTCGPSVLSAGLNALLILPIVIAGTIVASRLYDRAEDSRILMRQQEDAERVFVQAEREVNSQLESLVDEATRQLRRISEQPLMSEDDRHSLLQVEALIRVAIQVDPMSESAFGLLAMHLVQGACAEGVPVNVRSIEVSSDPRPVPTAVADTLRLVAHGTAPILSAFNDGTSDYLIVTAGLPVDAVPEPGIDGTVTVGDVELSVDSAAAAGVWPPRVVVRVSRPVQPTEQASPA